MRLPVNTVIHTTLVGLEPQPSDCWSDALPVVPPTHQHIVFSTQAEHKNSKPVKEEEEEIYLTQIRNNHNNSTQIVQSQVVRKPEGQQCWPPIHRTYKLLTYIQKAKKTHIHKYAPVALYQNKNKVQKVHHVYSNVIKCR